VVVEQDAVAIGMPAGTLRGEGTHATGRGKPARAEAGDVEICWGDGG